MTTNSEARFDVCFMPDEEIVLDYHFCRQWDGDEGCYGTNPNHGMSLDRACEDAAQYYERQAKSYRDKTHHQVESIIRDAEEGNK